MKWPMAKLGDVAPAERSVRDFAPDEVVWHLNLDQIESQTGRVLEKKRAPASQGGISTFAFDENHVLYSKLRPYLNKVVHPDEPGIATSELVPLRPQPDMLNPDFLKFYLRSDRFVGFANHVVAGAKMPRMIMDKFWLHEIPLPAPREQRRIVELLEQADVLRRQRLAADQLAGRTLPALFHKMFGDPATNPKSWPRVKLGLLLNGIDSGWSPVCENYPARPDEWGVLKLGAVTSDHYLDRENKALPAYEEPQPALEVKPGDLLFSRKNTQELVGACAYVQATRPKLMLSDLIFRLRLKAGSEVNPLYLWALLTMPGKRPAIEVLAGGSSGSMPNISKGRLETLEIETPPKRLQDQFAHSAARVDELCNSMSTSHDNLENLFRVLLHRAFTGELTAKWREAHLKELLVEMERQVKLLRTTAETN